MKTINYKEIEPTKNPHGVEAKKIHDNENVQVVHMLLKPGKVQKNIQPLLTYFFIYWKVKV